MKRTSATLDEVAADLESIDEKDLYNYPVGMLGIIKSAAARLRCHQVNALAAPSVEYPLSKREEPASQPGEGISEERQSVAQIYDRLTLDSAVEDAVKCMNIPASVKSALSACVKVEMQKRWECDDDVIDSFMFVAALMWTQAKGPNK